MRFYAQMSSGLGRILLCANGARLGGLYFIGQKDCPSLDGLPMPLPGARSPAAGMMAGLAIKDFKARKPPGVNRPRQASLDGMDEPAGMAAPASDVQHAGKRQGNVTDGLQDPLSFLQDDTPGSVRALFEQTQQELREYFRGERETFTVALHTEGTDFQKKVWRALLDIPYGQSVSYGDVARAAGLTPQHGRPVGAAVGRNPITIIIPCHRVLSGTGSLTGYTGGLERKFTLLELEGFSLE